MDNVSVKYKINQLIDNGSTVSISLIEDIELETVSQQQLMLEAIDRNLADKELKEQIRPLLEAIFQSQPQRIIQTYSKTTVQITMPRNRYLNMGQPKVGEFLNIDIKKG